jgi:hypothetical protein
MPIGAAQVIVAVIPIVGIVMGCVVLFFYFLWSHIEKMMMIEKGIYQPKRFDPYVFSLLSGLLMTGVGAALTFLFLALDGFQYSVIGGVLPLTIGVCLLIFYRISRSKSIGT